jgi:lipopolysaccharide biosynthesis glycosyltransferase
VTIKIKAENRPEKFRQSVIFCTDEAYLPFASLAIHTLLRSNQVRDYDICIASLDPLDLPAELRAHDIRLCQIDVGDAFDGMPVSKRFSIETYLRIALPEAFQGQYSRILYLDSDVFVVGDALDTIFHLDLMNYPVGAVTDITKLKHPDRPTFDQKALGLDGPYFNSGVMLLDVERFIAARVRARCAEAAQFYQGKLIYFDQTLLNIVLQNERAQLNMGWNWQWSFARSLFECFIDVQIVHFIGADKPWSAHRCKLPLKYREITRRYFQKFYPELAQKIPATDEPLGNGALFRYFFRHMTKIHLFTKGFNRHCGDLNKVLPPDLR